MLWRRPAVVTLVLFGVCGAIASCLDPRLHAPGDWNAPVVSTSNRGVAFTVSAYDFTFDQRYVGPMLGDSVAVTLVVSGYAAGNALVEVMDSSGAVRLQVPVAQEVVRAQTPTVVHGVPPYTVHVQFAQFRGVFILGVTAGW